MNIIIYVAHPSQYHFYKNIISKLKEWNYNIYLLSKTKDILQELLANDKIESINILPEGRKNNGLSIVFALFKRIYRLLRFIKNKKIDLMIASDSSIAIVGKIKRIKTIITLEDDIEVIPFLALTAYPFTNYIITPKVTRVGKWENKKIGYDGYQKLAYLHPNYFAPDENIFNKYFADSRNIFLVRLSGLTAHHDKKVEGISYELLLKIIEKLQLYGKVVISSEKPFDDDLNEYRLNIDVKDIHHILYYSFLLISDSQSMSVEASLLGVPSIRISSFAGKISVLEELEKKYKLTFGFLPEETDKIIDAVDELLKFQNLRTEWLKRRNSMLSDKIDVTEFIAQFIKNTYKQ